MHYRDPYSASKLKIIRSRNRIHGKMPTSCTSQSIEHTPGISRKQHKTIEKLEQHFQFQGNQLKYRKKLDEPFKLTVPPKVETRHHQKAHLFAHVKTEATINRIVSEGCYWPKMRVRVGAMVYQRNPSQTLVRSKMTPKYIGP